MKMLAVMIVLGGFVLALPVRADQGTASDYVLGPDDVISITVPSHADSEIDKNLAQTLTIQPDGRIAYPEIGQIMAAGKTPQVLAEEIKTTLEKTRRNVRVIVAVKEVHSRHVRIVGAIKTAGSYDIRPNWRLLDLIAVAGGLSAKPARVTGRLIRDGVKILLLDIPKATTAPDGDANLPLAPDDLVLLDEVDISNQIHVMGQVNKPGAYPLEDGLTLIALISEAGSPTEQAALSKAYVLRGNSQIAVNLLPIVGRGQFDEQVTRFRLQPGDVLFIPQIDSRYGVMGRVNRPGYYPMPEKEPVTVLKALSEAGGQMADSDLHKAGIIRTVNGKATVIPLDIEGMLKKGKMVDNQTLETNDVLYIPERGRPGFRWSDILNPILALHYLGL